MNSAILLFPLGLSLVALLPEGSIFSDLCRGPLGEYDYYTLHLAICGSLVTIAAWLPDARRKLGRRIPGIALAVAYGTIVLLATLVPPHEPVRALQCLLIPTTILALAFAVPALVDERAFDRLLTVVLYSLAALSILSLAITLSGTREFLGRALQYNPDGRGGSLVTSGLYYERNAIGSYLQFGPALALALRGKARLAIPALVVTTLCLVLTFSRSPLVVASLSCLPFVASRRRWLVAGGLLLAAWALLAFWKIGIDPTNRDIVWREAYAAALRRPLLGWGLFNIGFAWSGRETPHNFLLAQFVYYGIAGTAALVALLVVMAREAVARLTSTEKRIVACLLLGCLLQGMVEYIITYPLILSNSLFWLLAGRLHGERK